MKEFIEKLINRLEENGQKMCEAKSSVPYGKHSPSNHRYYKAISVKKAIHIVNQLAEEYNNGWIPCIERLPDKDMWCLATFESGGIDKIQYLVTNNWGWNGEFADNKVVAWMPLPEPFKPKGE